MIFASKGQVVTMPDAITNVISPSAYDANPPATDAVQQQVQSLGASIHAAFLKAVEQRQRNGMERELLECLYQAKSEYTPEDLAKIRLTGAPEVYIGLSDLKRRTAISIITEVFLNSADQSWTMRPTPVPETSEEDAKKIADRTMSDYVRLQAMKLAAQGIPLEQAEALINEIPPDPLVVAQYARTMRDEMDNLRTEEATRKVDRMAKKCRDQTAEGKWTEAMTAIVDDAATFGTCILKGPIRRNRKRTKFSGGVCVNKDTDVWEWSAISPLDAYPSKGAVEIGDGDFFERVRFTPKALDNMSRGGDGYFPSEIKAILALYPNGGYSLQQSIDAERKALENDGTSGTQDDSQIEGVEFWGDVKGSQLIQQGVTKTTDLTDIDADRYYETNAIVILNRVIFCTLTDEKLGRPLYKGVFYRVRGSWWGESPMKKMRDPQKAYNSTYRAKCINNAMSAGPMLFYDSGKLMAGTDLKLQPWRAYPFKDPSGNGTIPVRAFQPASTVDRLIMDLQETEKLCDTVTGIPAYSHGSDAAAGAGRTYNGLLLIVTASKQGANTVVFSLFQNVMKPALDMLYKINMLFDDDPDIKGDCEVDAGGLLSILVREQSFNRLNEFLQLSQNPNVMKVIGETGLAELLREYVKLLQGINPDNVVPSRHEMERRAQLAEIEAKLQQAEQMAMASSAQPIGSPTVAATAPSSANVSQVGRPSFEPSTPVEM